MGLRGRERIARLAPLLARSGDRLRQRLALTCELLGLADQHLDLLGERKPALIERGLLAGCRLGALSPGMLLDPDGLEPRAASGCGVQQAIDFALLHRLGSAFLR